MSTSTSTSTIASGERALYADGDIHSGRRWFDAAYREAERSGDVPAMARAALGLGGLWVHEHRTAAEAAMVRLRQREALARVDPASPLALRLRVRLAAEADYRTGGYDEALALLGKARDAGDPVALAEALSLAHHCVLGPEHGTLRLELATELIAEASRTGRRSDLLMGLLWHTVDLFLVGDPHAERSLGELRGMLKGHDHLAVGFVLSAIDVMISIRAGRFDQAEALAAECAQRGTEAGDVDATGWYAVQLATIRWYQGRVGELVPVLAELSGTPVLSAVDNSVYAGLAVAAATAGDRRLAESMLARLRGRDLAELPRSSSWLMSMYAITEAAALLGDALTAGQVYGLLLPYAGMPVIASLGAACFGSTRHTLGVAAMTMGDMERAIGHLEAAVHDNLAFGHWPAVVLSRSRLAEVYALVHGSHDGRARHELAKVERDADALGMMLPCASRRVAMARTGRQWRVELQGRGALVDHSVGMGYLATLLANPGQEIPAAELAGNPHADSTRQPVLDEEARRSYRRRLAQLEELPRSEAAEAERDWLLAELAAATGLGGRARQFAGNDERARIAVGKAIRRAVDRIAAVDRAIGDHLRATVHTGARCSYGPG
ncbi:hypothetical protein [Nonomuraea sediminis]|uniref:hypothetical protein n=1 Tax=Nonomuraea sediminis TaxID=2835864 RepID=UPI001BDC3790|nr:hypothetical protein [Nonomuraea sediminis]